MNIDFSAITEYQRYKVMEKSRIHAGCSGVRAPQRWMNAQRFIPTVCEFELAIAERK